MTLDSSTPDTTADKSPLAHPSNVSNSNDSSPCDTTVSQASKENISSAPTPIETPIPETPIPTKETSAPLAQTSSEGEPPLPTPPVEVSSTTDKEKQPQHVDKIPKQHVKKQNKRSTLSHSILKRNLFPLPVLLLAFPTFSVLFASLGFLMGISINIMWGILGFFLTCALAIIGGESYKKGFKRLGWFVLTVFLVFLADQSFIFFSWWDAQAYHIPASELLVQGWNPVFDSTHEALAQFIAQKDIGFFTPETFNIYHTSYLPRAGWIWNAICWTFTGNIELGDSLILFTTIGLAGLTWRLTPIFFGPSRWKRHLFTWLMVLSPGISISLFCGAHDGALYVLLIMFMFAACAYRKTGATEWLMYLILAPILGCNLKFTGLFNFLLTAFIFTLPIFWNFITKKRRPKKFWKWMTACFVGFFIALIVGLSPYITNWVQKGSPVYPEHTFSDSVETLEMTKDFTLCNNDAKMLNYFSRTSRAYLSESLTDAYYQHKIDTDDTIPDHKFEPVFHLDQVGGLGVGYRVVMWLILIIICFTRRCTTPWLLLSILLSSLIVPTKMVGYVRYVPQFWIFPMILAFNAMTVNTSRSPWIGRILGILITTTLLCASIFIAFGKILLSFSMSAYTLSVIEQAKQQPSTDLYILSREARYKTDGRCLATWELLPPNIPSKHLFDSYFNIMVQDIGLSSPHWLTQDEVELRSLDKTNYSFHINENLRIWCDPRTIDDPKHDLVNFEEYSQCSPKKQYLVSPPQFWKMSKTIFPQLPRYLIDITAFRIDQIKRHYSD